MHQRPRLPGAFTSALALVLASVLALTGCTVGGSGTGPGQESGAGSGSGPAQQSERADRVEPLTGPAPEPELPVRAATADGGTVTVRSARRIVPLSGSLSEIVHTLGLGGHVVARDITTTFAQARKLPVVTRAHDVSAESVLSLKPTVVLAERTTGPAEALDQIRDAGVPVVVLDPARELSDVDRRITAVAHTLGVDEAGERLVTRTDQRIADARDEIPAGGRRPRVAFLYVRGSASVYLLGGARSGASSLIEAAGGVDAGKESGLTRDFTPLTSEALAEAAPDVLLVMTKGLESVDGVDGLLKLPGVAETPAGQHRRVVAIDDGVLLNYGPRTDEVLRDLARRLHTGDHR